MARSRSRRRSRSAKRSRRSRSRRSRSVSRRRSRSPRSRSRKKPSKSPEVAKPPERTPPTDFSDYIQESLDSGWYKYKRTGKWRYHPEVGLYHHVKSDVYYGERQTADNDPETNAVCDFYLKGNCAFGASCRLRHSKPGEEDKDAAARFYKVDKDRDAGLFDKLAKCEQMRRALKKADFVKWEGGSAPRPSQSPEPEPSKAEARRGPSKSPPPAGPLQQGYILSFDNNKGYGFISPAQKQEDDENKGVFLHRKNIAGGTSQAPILLQEGMRVSYRVAAQEDGRPWAIEVQVLSKDTQPVPPPAPVPLEPKRQLVTSEILSVRFGAEAWAGMQQQMQDRYTMNESLEECGVFFGIFDGHGGSQVAEMVSKMLHRNLLVVYKQMKIQPSSRDEKIVQAVKKAFLQTDKEILEGATRKGLATVGTTAVVLILHGNPKLNVPLRLVVGHVGDSKAILCRGGEAIPLTKDHKPDSPEEKRRVEKAGGLILQVRGTWRVAASANPNSNRNKREYQGLGMTRSIGDMYFKTPSPLVVAEPDVTVHQMNEKDMSVVLGTDGVFDVLTPQKAVDATLKQWEHAEEAAKALVRQAFNRGSEDNISAVVVQFGWSDEKAATFAKHRLKKAAWEAKKKQDDEMGATGGKVSWEEMVASQKRVKAVEAEDFDMFG
mmetsp:Transcript_52908/g.113430  ORF Transcript_52908/g.113430 Transcript_52908/m.113430 type:complete len:662 (-) Transcript_52908:95-2080(-)